jgi:hypothetical protein
MPRSSCLPRTRRQHPSPSPSSTLVCLRAKQGEAFLRCFPARDRRPPIPLECWLRGVSSVGRAPALQAGGRRFEPGTLHQHPSTFQASRSSDATPANACPNSLRRTAVKSDLTRPTGPQRDPRKQPGRGFGTRRWAPSSRDAVVVQAGASSGCGSRLESHVPSARTTTRPTARSPMPTNICKPRSSASNPTWPGAASRSTSENV